ncbi:acetylglutamate kinase [Aliidiomarina haloalkalitolerans]|nr:acetylglutamate kinase [Aliidiomarina haloalkalitolerans]
MTSAVIKVAKVGGAILDNPQALAAFLQAIAVSQVPVVLVHGGGTTVDQQLQQAGFISEKVNGQRVTAVEHMPIITGALAGTTNKKIVAAAHGAGLKAVGLSLADGPMCALKRVAALGCVGEPMANAEKLPGVELLQLLLSSGFFPIVSSIGLDQDQTLCNVNADYAAAAIAMALNAELLLFSDVPAILDGHNNPINEISLAEARLLLSQPFIQGGMQVKLKAAILAAERSRRSTAIAGWADAQTVVAVLQGECLGTHIRV